MHCAGSPVRPTATKRRESGISILVVEDHGFVRDVTCEILRDAGYRVVHAECAAAARKGDGCGTSVEKPVLH
jgi:response regulator RpfG family c-di-GMP phosphodiesterase